MLRRTYLSEGGEVTVGGFAIAAEPLLAQAIQTDTAGLAAATSVRSGNDTIPAYQAHPDKPGQYPVIVVIS